MTTIPNADELKKLRAMAGRAHAADEALDAAVAAAFEMPGLTPTRSIDHALRLLKSTIAEWSHFDLEGYSESELQGEFSAEGYFFRLGAEFAPPSDPRQEPVHPTAELAILRAVLDYHVRWPEMKQRREAQERAKQERAALEAPDKPPAAEKPPEPPPKEYPDTLAGYVESWADWLGRMNAMQLEDPYDNADAETKAGISANYQTCIDIMNRQAVAITIMEEMLASEVAKSPTPRMRALKASIEAIYRS